MMLTPPFRHRATVERDAETGVDGRNNPLPPDFQVLNDDQPCDYWVASEILISGPDGNATGESERMLVPRAADIVVGDEISEVRDQVGEPLQTGRLRVVGDLRMEPSHRDLRLELVASSRAPEGS